MPDRMIGSCGTCARPKQLDKAQASYFRVADHGGFRGNMDKYGVVSTEIHDVAACIPDDLRAAYVNDSNRVGALIGMEDSRTLSGAPVPVAIAHSTRQIHTQYLTTKSVSDITCCVRHEV